jgi:Arc/MetJ family transcription regulator
MLDGMKKRTTLILDRDLISNAAEVLGTRNTTDTIHAALREVNAMEARRRLAARDFPDLTSEFLAEIRKPRTWPRR